MLWGAALLIALIACLLLSVAGLIWSLGYAMERLLPLFSDRYCDRKVAVLLSRHGEHAPQPAA